MIKTMKFECRIATHNSKRGMQILLRAVGCLLTIGIGKFEINYGSQSEFRTIGKPKHFTGCVLLKVEKCLHLKDMKVHYNIWLISEQLQLVLQRTTLALSPKILDKMFREKYQRCENSQGIKYSDNFR